MESFESYRPYLFAIAYRMLGSAMDQAKPVHNARNNFEVKSDVVP